MQPMGYAPQYAPQQQQMQPGYEFNEMENGTISSTARFAKIWGVISVITGLLVMGMGIVLVAVIAAMPLATGSGSASPMMKPAMLGALGISLIPTSLVSIIGGIFYFISGSSLQRVVETQGSDIPLMMQAVKSLSRAFMIEAIAMAVSFIVGLIIGIANQMGGLS